MRAIHESVSSEQQRRAAQKTNEWKECEELRRLMQNVTFEKMRGAVKKGGVGLGWGSRIRQHLSVEQEERQAIIRVFKEIQEDKRVVEVMTCLLYTSPSPRDRTRSRMPSSA